MSGIVRVDPIDNPARRIMLSGVSDEASFHDRIAVSLGFPGHYGRNLDALWDCLTDVVDPVVVVWLGWQDLAIDDPRGWTRILSVLRERADHGSDFTLVLV